MSFTIPPYRDSSRRPACAPVTTQGSKFIEMLEDFPSTSVLPRSTAAAPQFKSKRSAHTTDKKWTPLTPSEARALMKSARFPEQAPTFSLDGRSKMPRSEINRLSRKIGRENTLCRALNPNLPRLEATADQLHASHQFERDTMLL
ncbi:hypothetical protein C8R46DRAFT_1208920 [Mycena filopes]|nr:hypothetical protein C8R46DRAFT_1208920 [Mycena filopes]